MNRKLLLSAAALTVTSIIVGCTEPAAQAQADTAEEAASPATPPGVVEIPPTVRSNLGITFATVEKRSVANTLRLPGSFEVDPLARHEYRQMLPGRIEFAVSQYDHVEPGQVLYRFVSPQWPELQHEILEAEQAIAAAEASIKVAEALEQEARARLDSARQRVEALASAEVRRAELGATVAELEAAMPRVAAETKLARTRLGNARSQHEHAVHRAAVATGLDEATLTETVEHEGEQRPRYRAVEALEVKATEAGIVESLATTNGAYVEAPGLVLTTTDPTRLRFRATALQDDLSRINTDAPASIVPPSTRGTSANAALPADVVVGLEAHPEQRTVALVARPEESAIWARPGVSGFLEVTVDSTTAPRLAIPESAVVRDGLVDVFFRRDANNPNRATRVEADLGASDGRWIVVNSGVRLGDEVVLDGVFELKLATASAGTQQEGGHFHADGAFHESH